MDGWTARDLGSKVDSSQLRRHEWQKNQIVALMDLCPMATSVCDGNPKGKTPLTSASRLSNSTLLSGHLRPEVSEEAAATKIQAAFKGKTAAVFWMKVRDATVSKEGNFMVTLADAAAPGLEFVSLPPQPSLRVAKVLPQLGEVSGDWGWNRLEDQDGWAEQNGIMLGVLVAACWTQSSGKNSIGDRLLKLGSDTAAWKDVTTMGVRPNREPPQKDVQILAVKTKSWAEQQGIQSADHLLMINHKRTTTLARDEYHRLMSSVRPLHFTLAPSSESEKREVAATRLQLLYRMRKARKAMKEKKAEREGAAAAAQSSPSEGESGKLKGSGAKREDKAAEG
ncbi:unnamed protein product [Effrenium voratum]|nr:unnamed protein product [Effrenium voratum]